MSAPALAPLAPALLGFWALYFAVIALSNLTDLLRWLGLLPDGWWWISGNLAFIATATARFGVSARGAAALLAGAIIWLALVTALFARALRRPPTDAVLAPPFAASLALWGTFILLDEVLLIYETGVEATHFRLLGAELLSLLVIRAVRRA